MDEIRILTFFYVKRTIKDFFLLIYSIIYPMVSILLLGYISSKLFTGDRNITSYTYYTIVTLPFFILNFLITMAYLAKDESMNRVSYRFLIAPINKRNIVISKVISASVVVSLYNVFLLVILKFLLNLKLGQELYKLAALLSLETFMITAIGIFIGISFQDFRKIKTILMIPLNLMGFLGGAFFPVGSLGATFEKLSYISPLTWSNRAVMQMLYDNSSSLYMNVAIVTIVIGIFFTLLSVVTFKKEAFL